MQLGNARICIDCDEVYDMMMYQQCPACGSRQSAALQRWLRPLRNVCDAVLLSRQAAERARVEADHLMRQGSLGVHQTGTRTRVEAVHA